MRGDPIGLPGLAAMWIGFLVFAIATLAARRRAGADPAGGVPRTRRSRWGVFIQGLGIGAAAFGPERIILNPLGAPALIEAAAVALLMASVVGLFVWATRAMGRNWSIVARMRADHSLVTDGPFAWMRHPIYTALFLLMLALAIATGHVRQLLLGIPLFVLGTALRIGEEERMLRTTFAGAYDAYAARVRRFVPGLF